jgi:hypothetical protein
MALSSERDCRDRAVEAFEPVSDMLDVGRCEPLKAAVHGVMLATVTLCALYNAAAWLKRRQRHLAINAIIYGAAIWWERSHVLHHLVECDTVEPIRLAGPTRLPNPLVTPAPGEDRTAA